MPEPDAVPFGISYPLGFLVRTAATVAGASALGLVLLRWVFYRELGEEYARAFYTLKSLATFLAPALVFSLLAVLLVASGAVFLVALFASHKVAGPLFRLQRVAGYLERRVLVGRIHLRGADQGKPVAQEINRWVDLQRGRLDAARGAVQGAEDALDRAKRCLASGDGAGTAENLDRVRSALEPLAHPEATRRPTPPPARDPLGTQAESSRPAVQPGPVPGQQ